MTIKPKDLLEELCKNASLRKEQSLRLIFSICKEQSSRGSNDYSIVTIGKLSSDRGGPSPGAIRNKPGEDYRALIKAYSDSVHGFNSKKMASIKTESDDLLEGITDPVLRVRLNLILAEVRSLKAQLLAARHLANQNSVVELKKVENHSTSEDVVSNEPTLNLQEVSALEAAISTSTFEHWGWKEDATGRVKNESNQVVFRAGFVPAIRKIIKCKSIT